MFTAIQKGVNDYRLQLFKRKRLSFAAIQQVGLALQQQVSAEVEAAKVGTDMRVIIDRKEGDYYIGRSEFCSPEVDPEVLVSADKRLRVGCFYNVHINDSDDFDLYATLIEK